MSGALAKIADARLAAGDHAGSLSAYEESLATIRKLAAADPGNADWQVDLVVILTNLSAISNASRARAWLREALVIVEALEKGSKLAAQQQGLPKLIRDRLTAVGSDDSGDPTIMRR